MLDLRMSKKDGLQVLTELMSRRVPEPRIIVMTAFEDELDLLTKNGESRKKLVKAMREFRGYIEANQNFIPNYGDR